MNGVFLNDKGTSGNVIYEVLDSHNESRPRDPNELFKYILSSDSDDPATKSADELRTKEKGEVSTRQGHQTDSEFERLQEITYYDEPPNKIKATSTEMKPQQIVMKVDQSVTNAEQSATKIDGKTSIRLYFRSMFKATFWTDGGLCHHESLHFRKSAFEPYYHTHELEKKCQETEDMNGENPQPNGDKTEEKDDKPNEKDSKDIRNGEKTEESEEEEKQKGNE